MRLPVSVCVYPAALCNDKWQFLLLKRTPIPSLGLSAFWQGITGGVESGETIAQAAARELYEETALPPVSINAINCIYRYPILPAWRHRYPCDVTEITEHVFVATIAAQQAPVLCQEHTEYCWCDYGQAINLLFFEENKRTLPLCVEYLDRCQ